jgi:hypothetical protein
MNSIISKSVPFYSVQGNPFIGFFDGYCALKRIGVGGSMMLTNLGIGWGDGGGLE